MSAIPRKVLEAIFSGLSIHSLPLPRSFCKSTTMGMFTTATSSPAINIDSTKLGFKGEMTIYFRWIGWLQDMMLEVRVMTPTKILFSMNTGRWHI